MNLNVSDPKTIVIIALAVVVGWFAVGILYNLRKGNRALRWLQGGLPLLGEKTTFRWLGSSVAQMEIVRPRRPFRNVQLMLVLAPRDVPWLWLLAAARGRRDILIVRAQLLGAARGDLELTDPGSWTGKTALSEAGRKAWVCEPRGRHFLCAPADGMENARRGLPVLEALLPRLGSPLIRLGIRTEGPQLELHLRLPGAAQDSGAFVRTLQEMARAIVTESSADGHRAPADSGGSRDAPTGRPGQGRARRRGARSAGRP